jgi:DNA-binding transcriptional regulator YhcF (GntR family)
MDKQIDPKAMLHEMAQGSFGRVIQRNNKLILIRANTEKVKNHVLREFIEEALKDGYTHEDLIEVLLEMDAAVEKNEVRKTLQEYLK